MAERYQAAGQAVTVEVEDFGVSPLGAAFGFERYPAVWVDGVLLARPEDFHDWQPSSGGSLEQGPTTGRYAPFQEPAAQARFLVDLERLLARRLVPEAALAVPALPDAAVGPALAATPAVDLFDRPLPSLAAPGPLLVVYLTAPCLPCLDSVRRVQALASALGPEAPPAMVVAVGLDADAARRLVLAQQITLPVILGAPAGSAGGLRAAALGFPEVVLLRGGREVASWLGPQADLATTLRAALASGGPQRTDAAAAPPVP